MERDIFGCKSPVREKLIAFGFRERDGGFVYAEPILEGELTVTVKVTERGVETETTDPLTGEPYSLHLVEEAQGAFVGSVRAAYNALLRRVAEECFVTDVFKSDAARSAIGYVSERYGISLEFLWEKLPDAAVWRRQDNRKWFGVLMPVPASKLGLDAEGKLEILDLRADPDVVAEITDNVHYFPGYHMNKKHWITIPLDGSVPPEEIFARIDDSYILANAKKR